MPCRIRQFGLLSALLLASVSLADDPATPAKSQDPAEKPSVATAGPVVPAHPVPVLPFDIRYLLGDDGQPVFVPDGVHLRGYLNWLAREFANQQPPIPYSVTSIECTGAADDDLLHLNVAIRIRTTTDEWVFVPLQMAEATLREPPRYRGPGDYLQEPYHPDTGYAWWFKGKKGERDEHELTLSLVVPIRRQTPGRRVQLSLAPTAVSSLKLRIPHGRVVARSSEKSNISWKSAGGESEINVIGLGPRMDVSWQVLPELPAVDTTLEVVTSMTATLAEAERTSTLVATQTIRSVGQQGTFDHVRVKLPAGGELLSVDSSEYLEHHTDPDDATRVVVKLQRQTAGPFDLRWTVRIPLPPAGEPFVVEGFDVDRARIQSGFLAVAIVGDFRLAPVADAGRNEQQDRSVQRINLDALPVALRQARTTVAYRFENRLHLRLSLRRVDPYVSASPEAWVQIDREMVQFAATYEFLVLRGSISEVAFRWPGWKGAGWIVDRIEPSENLGAQLLDDAAAPDMLRVEFTEAVQKRFKLTIRARRVLPEADASVQFALPVAETLARSAARLAILRPQNIELDLQAAEGTILRPQSESTARVAVPRELQKLHRDEYRVDSPEASFSAAITVHPREVTASTTVSASQDRPGMTVVRQRIAYNVAYGSLPEVRFRVPAGLRREQLLVSEADGNELTNQLAEAQTEREIRVPLDPPRSGRFELDLQYASEATVAATPDGEQALTIPFVVSGDAEFSETQFQWRDAQGREATVRDGDWTRFPDPNGRWVWKLPRSATGIDVELSQSAGAWGGATVTRALIRSAIGADGIIHTRADYRLAGAVLDLAVGLPGEVQLMSVWWDGHQLKLPARQVDETGAARYRIVPDRTTGATAVLTIVTSAPGAVLSRFTGVSELTAPRLPESLPVLDSRWQVTLPFSRHLFTEPEGFAPAYRWMRAGLFWSRHPDRTSAELEEWIGTPGIPVGSTALDTGNTYLFSRAATADALRFRAMSLSGIVLVGASLALFLGWIIVRYPVTRHVLTLLFAGFSVALAAVWFAEPVLVLLQPALLGLLLAAVAAGIDRFGKRRQPSVAVTLNSASGYVTPTSSIARGAVLGVGSNEYTSVRMPEVEHPADADELAGQLSETGSRS